MGWKGRNTVYKNVETVIRKALTGKWRMDEEEWKKMVNCWTAPKQ